MITTLSSHWRIDQYPIRAPPETSWKSYSISRTVVIDLEEHDGAHLQMKWALKIHGNPQSKLRLLRWPFDQEFWNRVAGETDYVCSVGAAVVDLLR